MYDMLDTAMIPTQVGDPRNNMAKHIPIQKQAPYKCSIREAIGTIEWRQATNIDVWRRIGEGYRKIRKGIEAQSVVRYSTIKMSLGVHVKRCW